ncbi:MAG TPA: VOC family protein [Woeseiaceae bacterium]|nr:VOC family protein [Woeseiaceae bacterium]
MADDHFRATVSPAISYRDPKAALQWLEEAFGFEPFMVVTDKDGNLLHSEMRVGEDGVLMIGSEWSEDHRSPASLGGKNTQSVHIQMKEGIDAHCERARRAGAAILRGPSDQFYGDRGYTARDLEGHVWTFGQTVKRLTREEWDRAGGTITRSRL